MHKLPIFARIKETMGVMDKFLFEVRIQAAQDAGWNVFRFPASYVAVDLLSDSGTGPLSPKQIALLARGNEQVNCAYGMRDSFLTLQEAVADIFGLGVPEKDFYFFPFPQGRAAESVFFETLRKELTEDMARTIYPTEPPFRPPQISIISNSHFDTTRANIELAGFEAHDLPIPKWAHGENDVFSGGIDTSQLKFLLHGSRYGCPADNEVGDPPPVSIIPAVFMTITNNTRGGLPVSMENIRATSELCREYEVPFFLDAARFAENAYFIKKYEEGYAEKSIREIVREMISHCDGFLISFKKDGLSHTGGGLVLKNPSLFLSRYPHFPDAVRTRLITTMSNDTQGAIPGGYQLAISEGLYTATTMEYLEARVSQVARFGKMLKNAGVPVLEPFGGHAVYVDTNRFFDGAVMKLTDFGGVSLTAILLLYGVRACELGAFAFGKYDKEKNTETPPLFNYVRLAIPRRGYADEELVPAVDALKTLHELRLFVPRAVPVYGRDLPLRHMKARFELEPR